MVSAFEFFGLSLSKGFPIPRDDSFFIFARFKQEKRGFSIVADFLNPAVATSYRGLFFS